MIGLKRIGLKKNWSEKNWIQNNDLKNLKNKLEEIWKIFLKSLKNCTNYKLVNTAKKKHENVVWLKCFHNGSKNNQNINPKNSF